jgi:hypothetical protein
MAVAGEAIDSIGDLNGDGFRDLLIGVPSVEQVEVRSGRNGNLLDTLQVANTPALTVMAFGRAVVAIGDIDFDGVEDIAVGAPDSHANPANGHDNGRAFIFSGASVGSSPTPIAVLEQTYQFGFVCPTSGEFSYGDVLARVGDVTFDGVPEIAVGSTTTCGGAFEGRVEVWDVSVTPPQILATFAVPATGGGLSFSMCSIGDVIFDGGRDDLAVGIPGGDQVRIFKGQQLGIPGGDAIGPFSLVNGTVSQFGFSVALPGDLTGDGVNDLLVGAPGLAGSGSFYACSGAAMISGAMSSPYGPPTPPLGTPPSLGWSVSSIGDWDVDGVPDLLIGAPGSLTATAGYVRVVSGATFATLLTVNAPTSSSTFGIAVSETNNPPGAVGKPPFVVADPGAGFVHVY